MGEPELLIIRCDERCSHVALRGSLDIRGTQRIEPQFTAAVTARHRATIIELQGLTFLASYGLSMIIAASRAIRARKHPFILVGASDEIDAILRATRLHQIMSIVATIDEANALVQAAGPEHLA